jgi:oligopeptide/dipeptide ABC transporter ATP-binding protein
MICGRIVETADADELFDNPGHPYTRGLLASVPRFRVRTRERLTPIEGAPPDLIAPPEGCRFRPRCPLAFERCLEEPPLIALGAGHQSRCWLAAS